MKSFFSYQPPKVSVFTPKLLVSDANTPLRLMSYSVVRNAR